MVGVRLQPDQLAQLDAWINDQPEPQPTRPEAVRRLLRERLAEIGHLPEQDQEES